MTDMTAEAAWVRGAQTGSADAFGRLVQMHQQGLRAFLRRLSATDADDLAQETFVFAWEHIGRFDPARSFRPWLSCEGICLLNTPPNGRDRQLSAGYPPDCTVRQSGDFHPL